MEDYIIARQLNAAPGSLTFPAATVSRFAQADPKRVAITVSSDGTGRFFVGPAGTLTATGGGMLLSTETPALTFTIEHWGQLITQPWEVVETAAGGVLFFVLTSLERMK